MIAAVRNEEELDLALASKVKIIFCLHTSINQIGESAARIHARKKQMFLHIDLAEGVGKDRAGLEFVKAQGVDGIISTRAGIIKLAKELELTAVQRFFLMDSQSLNTMLASLRTSKADMIEVMPGVIPKVIASLKEKIDRPMIAGGLIEQESEIAAAFASGAAAVSIGKREFWNL